MRFLVLFAVLVVTLKAAPETQASRVWLELEAQREKLQGLHQEFEVTQTFQTAHGSQSAKQQTSIDMSGGQWREKSVTGSGTHIKIFNGKDLFSMEEGGGEYVRTKRRSKEADPRPFPYDFGNPDWPKVVELERRPCGIAKIDHQCVLLEVPLKPWTRVNSPSNVTKMMGGSARILLDTETGLLISSRTVQAIDNQRGGYQSDVTCVLKRMSYGAAGDASLFRLPSNDMDEVKQLSSWNAARIKKQLAGSPAPELAVTDIQGRPVKLTDFRGRTVLLDFWTTWCPPCRADAPALDKLFRRYGDKDLMIVGVSVSEDREIVKKFLSEHPHSFPIVLTTENEMPQAYQIGVFPTYVVIDRDGKVASAAEGDQGFAELRKLLTKAGLESE